jgi:hypothetical protein
MFTSYVHGLKYNWTHFFIKKMARAGHEAGRAEPSVWTRLFTLKTLGVQSGS